MDERRSLFPAVPTFKEALKLNANVKSLAGAVLYNR